MRTTLPGTAVSPNARVRRTTFTGEVIDGRYEVLAKIAAGGFGSIYRAVDLSNGVEVALKVLHADLASDANLAARFRRESEMLALLRDARTVATYGAGETEDGTLYIALELLNGESLEQRFATGDSIGWREVLSIVRDVCSSLREAHSLGIVHRDLKPGNIFLANEGVKVIDFGIAKRETADGDPAITRIGQAIGTLDYMAPEQLVGGDCDGRTDLYTLGVVAYEALTGVRPFEDAVGATGLITALLTRTALAPSLRVRTVPLEVDAMVLKLLEREPDDRFASASELAATIDRVLAPFETAYDDEVTTIDMAPVFAFEKTAPTPKLERLPEGSREQNSLYATMKGTKPAPISKPHATPVSKTHATPAPKLATASSDPIARFEPAAEPMFAEGTVDDPASSRPSIGTIDGRAATYAPELPRNTGSLDVVDAFDRVALSQSLPMFASIEPPAPPAELADGTIDGVDPVLKCRRRMTLISRIAIAAAVAIASGAALFAIS